MAEVRWQQTAHRGTLRFGVDFDPRPDQPEDEEVRRAAYDLANNMSDTIDLLALHTHLLQVLPEVAPLLSRQRSSRPHVKGDWETVIVRGFKGAALPGGVANNRQRTNPGFYGDGTLRFQAIADIDFHHASAADLTTMLATTVTYLKESEPE